MAQEQLREAGIGLGAALLEPVGRNTAPALTLAALHAVELSLDPILVVKIDPRYFRPTEVETLLGDPSKAKTKLGWGCLVFAYDILWTISQLLKDE